MFYLNLVLDSERSEEYIDFIMMTCVFCVCVACTPELIKIMIEF